MYPPSPFPAAAPLTMDVDAPENAKPRTIEPLCSLTPSSRPLTLPMVARADRCSTHPESHATALEPCQRCHFEARRRDAAPQIRAELATALASLRSVQQRLRDFGGNVPGKLLQQTDDAERGARQAVFSARVWDALTPPK